MHALGTELQIELLWRLVLSVLLGSVLGWERQLGRHPAGLRTHMLVSMGSTAFTIVSVYGVSVVYGSGIGTVQDPGRIAAQIITGIGFLGAGTIWRSSGEQGVVRGLTTAASIWVAAAIGMMTGYGLYWLAAGCAVLGFVVLRLIKGVEEAPHALSQLTRRVIRWGTPATGTQPARPPIVLESPPAETPAAGEVVPAPSILDGSTSKVHERPPHPKLLRRGKKKDRKRNRGDESSETVDQIAD